MGWFDFFKRPAEPLTLPLVREVHRRADVVKEHANRTPARSEIVIPFPSEGIHTQRKRDIINESLDIAMKTKRRDTAESRLQVTEDLLDALTDDGHPGRGSVHPHHLDHAQGQSAMLAMITAHEAKAELFKDFIIREVPTEYSMAKDGVKPVTELLIFNYEPPKKV